MMKRKRLRIVAVAVGMVISQSSMAIYEGFSGGLGNWSGTAILDDNGGSANRSVWQVNGSGNLELATSEYDGIEQWAYIRKGASLAVGDEVQLTVANWTITGAAGHESFGLFVGGAEPVPGSRNNYITVYGKHNNPRVFQRGFDGTGEFRNYPNYNPLGVTKLFIARTGVNTYEWGSYDGETRRVAGTCVPSTANSGNVVGIYADVRAAGTIGAIESFQIISTEPATMGLITE
ncbi:hypothetical protein P4C99_06195 [Pontiellaceae bacterium B1224]|nr:hypothetical protein [Pontiellaceae bacterium B1224]